MGADLVLGVSITQQATENWSNAGNCINWPKLGGTVTSKKVAPAPLCILWQITGSKKLYLDNGYNDLTLPAELCLWEVVNLNSILTRDRLPNFFCFLRHTKKNYLNLQKMVYF